MFIAPTQLAAEWVDFRNDTGDDVALVGVSLWHLAYAPSGTRDWERVQNFTGTLPNAVTERLNAATEERLKTGHAVGALSIA